MSVDRAPWKRLADLEPPLGANRRVLSHVEDEIYIPATRRRWIVVVVPAALAALALAAWVSNRDVDPPATRSGAEPPTDSAAVRPPPAGEGRGGGAAREQPAVESAAVRPPPPAEGRGGGAEPEIRVAAGDRMAINYGRAKLIVRGPAAVVIAADRMRINRGTVQVDGITQLEAPACSARVDGRARVKVTGDSVRIEVFEGSAEALPGTPDCTVERVARKRPAPRAQAATHEPHEPTTAPPTPSQLRRQVRAFRRARALTGAEALAAWKALLVEWPHSPFRTEAEAAIRRLESEAP